MVIVNRRNFLKATAGCAVAGVAAPVAAEPAILSEKYGFHLAALGFTHKANQVQVLAFLGLKPR